MSVDVDEVLKDTCWNSFVFEGRSQKSLNFFPPKPQFNLWKTPSNGNPSHMMRIHHSFVHLVMFKVNKFEGISSGLKKIAKKKTRFWARTVHVPKSLFGKLSEFTRWNNSPHRCPATLVKECHFEEIFIKPTFATIVSHSFRRSLKTWNLKWIWCFTSLDASVLFFLNRVWNHCQWISPKNERIWYFIFFKNWSSTKKTKNFENTVDGGAKVSSSSSSASGYKTWIHPAVEKKCASKFKRSENHR